MIFCIHSIYSNTYQDSPQDFIKVSSSSHSAGFIRDLKNKLLKGCCMPSSAIIHIRKCCL